MQHISEENVIIRKAKLSDIEDVVNLEFCEIYNQFFIQNTNVVNNNYKEILKSQYPKQIESNTTFIYVAEINKKLIGYCRYYINDINEVYRIKKSAMFAGMYVKKDFRHNKIGSKLVNHCIDKIHKDDIISIRTIYSIKNPESTGFWESFGFKPRNTISYLPFDFNEPFLENKKDEELNFNC